MDSLIRSQRFQKIDGIYLENESGVKTSGAYDSRQKQIYDSRTDSYKEQVQSNYPESCGFNKLLLTYREHLRWVKKLKLKDDDCVLDIGCNIGQLLHLMNYQAKIKGVGVDISIEALQNARLILPENFEFVLCSIEKGLPFEDNAFDVIVCMDVIEHLENPQVVLKEMYRVLKPGGRFLFHVPVTDLFLSLDWFYQKIMPKSFDKKMQDAGHFLEVMKTHNQLQNMILGNGFAITKTRRFNSLLQTMFDYHITHRILNRMFFIWKMPFKFYHFAIAPIIELFILLPDRILQKMNVGSSAYYLGKK
ncbi:MAG: class I SAM-dependent methyltransferase [Bacteriovorax sp.]|nr:class I SAM-dependent methyltransferase [Bacteriovorax sp.]